MAPTTPSDQTDGKAQERSTLIRFIRECGVFELGFVSDFYLSDALKHVAERDALPVDPQTQAIVGWLDSRLNTRSDGWRWSDPGRDADVAAFLLVHYHGIFDAVAVLAQWAAVFAQLSERCQTDWSERPPPIMTAWDERHRYLQLGRKMLRKEGFDWTLVGVQPSQSRPSWLTSSGESNPPQQLDVAVSEQAAVSSRPPTTAQTPVAAPPVATAPLPSGLTLSKAKAPRTQMSSQDGSPGGVSEASAVETVLPLETTPMAKDPRKRPRAWKGADKLHPTAQAILGIVTPYIRSPPAALVPDRIVDGTNARTEWMTWSSTDDDYASVLRLGDDLQSIPDVAAVFIGWAIALPRNPGGWAGDISAPTPTPRFVEAEKEPHRHLVHGHEVLQARVPPVNWSLIPNPERWAIPNEQTKAQLERDAASGKEATRPPPSTDLEEKTESDRANLLLVIRALHAMRKKEPSEKKGAARIVRWLRDNVGEGTDEVLSEPTVRRVLSEALDGSKIEDEKD